MQIQQYEEVCHCMAPSYPAGNTFICSISMGVIPVLENSLLVLFDSCLIPHCVDILLFISQLPFLIDIRFFSPTFCYCRQSSTKFYFCGKTKKWSVYMHILGWPKFSLGFFFEILWKNPSKLFGQLTIMRGTVSSKAC